MSPILKCTEDDEEKELDFEINFQLSLTTEQRFELMFKRSQEIAKALIENGYREPFKIIKRK